MRTLLLCPALFSTTGGIERILQLYLRTLCPAGAPPDQVRLAVLNDTTIPLDVAARCEATLVGAGRRLTFARQVLRLAHDCDRLLCGHVNLLPLAWLAQRLYPKLSYALVAHGIEVWSRPSRWHRLALRGAARVLCVSDYTRRVMLSLDPKLEPARFVTVPNALDPAFVAAAGAAPIGTEPSTAPIILVVSRLSAADNYKGIDHVIAALPTVIQELPDVQLRIVGDGDDRSRLEKLAREIKPPAEIVFTGRISDDALMDELRSCALFALPSAREGFGLVYLEAMAFGKPCIAAEAGGAPEVISPASGLTVPFGDVPALAEAIIRALKRSWAATAIRARAAEFSPEHFASRFLAAWPTP